MMSNNIFTNKEHNSKNYQIVDLKKIFNENLELKALPFSMRILLENVIRNEHSNLTKIILNFKNWLKNDEQTFEKEINFYPSRVLMQDFTGVPAVVDLAAMRDAAVLASKDACKINPVIPVDLVIDHSVQVNFYGSRDSLKKNIKREMEENIERYKFLKWGQKSFKNFKLVPPGMGICHQVNLEYLASVVFKNDEKNQIYPETIVGTDSHTTMINGLGVIGWGVGGIEAESAMLGDPIPMNIPRVVGFKLNGNLKEGVTATDLVLTITKMLRDKGVVGKIVEFYGDGMRALSLPDRATIANMAPEYGATSGFFPIDKKTIEYLELSGRTNDSIKLVEDYAREQMFWAGKKDDCSFEDENFHFSDFIELNLENVSPCLAGPTRPQDKCTLNEILSSLKENFPREFSEENLKKKFYLNGEISINDECSNQTKENEKKFLKHGDIVLAAITSCTNTSNPSVLIAAGLLAKAAHERGLKINPLIKTSLAPGSKVVSDYLQESGLQEYLNFLGFNIVGYGCTTCIGNSGSLKPEIEKIIGDNDLCVGGILSGNRNFEGRIQPFIKANYLASPPLVVAFALAGTLLINFDKDPIAFSDSGEKIMLSDLWPSNALLDEYIKKFVKKEFFIKEYSKIFDGDEEWKKIDVENSEKYTWDENSTYIKNPPYFKNFEWKKEAKMHDIVDARILALLGDSITTDHISPAGTIKSNSPAGVYLHEKGISIENFNSYGSRRGNHEVMIRGTFANIRLANLITKDDKGEIKKGCYTKYFKSHSEIINETRNDNEMVNSTLSTEVTDENDFTLKKESCFSDHKDEIISIYEASILYQKNQVPLVIFAGKYYGSGSSRDWAAKGTSLLGVKAVIAKSFERIHRSNLIGMGVVPFIFKDTQEDLMSWEKLDLKGDEIISINLSEICTPMQNISCEIKFFDGSLKTIDLIAYIFNESEIETLLYGGIMQKALSNLYSTYNKDAGIIEKDL